jgi:MerR family transcriptional activator of bmr gene
MKNTLFTIGQTSKIKGITVKALRFYERIGLITPDYTDAVTKYRYYSLEQFIQLDVIKALRSIDVGPKDIGVILEKRDTRQLLEYLDSQKENIRRKIALLQKTITTIEQAQNTIHNSLTVITHQEVTTRNIPKRLIITQKVKKEVSEEEALLLFSKFPQIIEENSLLDTYETGYYCTPDERGEFNPSLIYNAVTTGKSSNKTLLSTIPAGPF